MRTNRETRNEARNEEKAQDSGDRPPNGKVLILGDSHVKRLDRKKMKNIIPYGYGGLKNDQVLIKHK